MIKTSISILVVVVTGVGLIGFSAVARPIPMVIWNASASIPVGLYRVVIDVPNRDDLVLVRTPNSVKILADRRGYLPIGVSLVKRVAAVDGDVVCASSSVVAINDLKVARQLKADRVGRLLPRWNGCHRLKSDEYFLLGNTPDSLDSRYFGPVKSDRVIGRLEPLWTE
ncbi:MAG: S26 family signal peptidase [Bdellovibrionales bacterium]